MTRYIYNTINDSHALDQTLIAAELHYPTAKIRQRHYQTNIKECHALHQTSERNYWMPQQILLYGAVMIHKDRHGDRCTLLYASTDNLTDSQDDHPRALSQAFHHRFETYRKLRMQYYSI